MKLTIKVKWTLDNDVREQQVVTSLATVVAWERHFRRKASEMGSGIGMEDILFLAWHRLNATKVDVRQFDEWVESVEDVEIVEAGDAGPPTKPATSGAN